MTDRQLQLYFEGKNFIINGIKRECYYCTLEGGGAWIWLRNAPNEQYKSINFVVRYKSDLELLYDQVIRGENINEKEYGYLYFQN